MTGGRRCLLLSGVHKGGADSLVRVLRHLGVDDAAEPADFAERLQSLNEAILQSAGFDEVSIEPLHEGWYSSLRHAEFHSRAIKLIRSAHPSSALFVLKGAAIGRLVPFWRSVLKACDVEPVILDFYEDPQGYADALLQSAGVGGEAARTVWLARVIESERVSRNLLRAQLTQDALVEDWEAALGRLSQTLGLTWPAWSSRVRQAIVGELAYGTHGASRRAVNKLTAPDQLGQWRQVVQDVIWRWAREGEDDRGRARLDELGQLFDEAREFVGIAFATVTQLGEELRDHMQSADDLKEQIASLQRKSDAITASAEAQAGEVEALRATLAKLEGERGDLTDSPQKGKDELARIEAKWAEVFKSNRERVEILTEQNNVFQAAIERLTAEVEILEANLSKATSETDRLRLVEIAQKADIGAARSEIAAARSEVSAARSDVAAARAEVAEARKSREEMRKSVAEMRDRMARLRSEARGLEATIEKLQNELMSRTASGTGVDAGSVWQEVKSSLSPKALLLHLKPKTRKKVLRHQRVRHLVSASGMFDAEFYASRYPDIVAAGEDLLDHFIRYGGAEGRHPSLSFNSRWYLNENPDVLAAGLNPLVHYIEYGRDEGRRRRSLLDTGPRSSSAGEASAAPTSQPTALEAQISPPAEAKAAESELEAAWRPQTGGWRAMLSPDGGPDAAAGSPQQLAARDDARAITIADTSIASLSGDTARTALDRIGLFAAMMKPGDAAPVAIAGQSVSDAAPHTLLARAGCGLDQLADGWWDSEAILTLRLAGRSDGAVRVFQADSEGHLQCVADAVPAGSDVDLVEVRLVDPIAALLVIRAQRDGTLIDSAVLPFPSLLRGGLHYGELAVLETAPGSMATLAQYSQVLALEWLGWAQGPEGFAIGSIDVDMRGASGTEPVFRPALLTSIARQFGIAIRAKDGSFAPQRAQLAAVLEASGPDGAEALRRTESGRLVLPCDAIPSIYAMVARRMPHDPSLSRFAVVDAATVRPRADVSLPYDADLARLQHDEMPAHAPYVVLADARADASGGAIFPLAVRHYNKLAWEADPLIPVSPDQDMATATAEGAGKAITVIIDIAADTDAEALATCLAGLENQIGPEQISVILTGWPEAAPLPSCALPVRAIDGSDLTVAGRLNAAAELCETAWLLILDPAVLLSDPRIIATLARLAERPGTASAACALVTEVPDDAHARVHSAGYFPSRISLLGEPVFDFDQFDIDRVMPAAAYPVVANHAKCVLYDVAVFRSLGGFDAQRFPLGMHDLDLGFRALAAGHTNLCTTLVRAAIEDAAPSADFPDPLAHRSVRPADWQSLFDRVTVVKELRR